MRRQYSFSIPASPVTVAGILGVVFVLIGAVFLLITTGAREKAEAAQAWPSASGQVVKTWVQEDVERDSDGRIDRDYTPEVQYEYLVGGKAYTSQQLSFGFRTVYNSQQEAGEALQEFPVGKPLAVYYNPENPGEAVLDRELKGGSLGMAVGVGGVVLGGVFLLLPLARFFFGLRRRLAPV